MFLVLSAQCNGEKKDQEYSEDIAKLLGKDVNITPEEEIKWKPALVCVHNIVTAYPGPNNGSYLHLIGNAGPIRVRESFQYILSYIPRNLIVNADSGPNEQ